MAPDCDQLDKPPNRIILSGTPVVPCQPCAGHVVVKDASPNLWEPLAAASDGSQTPQCAPCDHSTQPWLVTLHGQGSAGTVSPQLNSQCLSQPGIDELAGPGTRIPHEECNTYGSLSDGPSRPHVSSVYPAKASIPQLEPPQAPIGRACAELEPS